MGASARSAVWSVAVLVGVVLAGPACPAELSGNARVFWGETGRVVDGIDVQETELLNQQYSVTLTQPITPWISFLINYRYTDLSTKPNIGIDQKRTNSIPLVELTYKRPTFDLRLMYYHRDIDSTNAAQSLDGDSFQAIANWFPNKGPRHSFTYLDDTNTNDVAVFGRDTRTQNFKYDLLWFKVPWDVRYTFGLNKLTNRVRDLDVRQMINEVRVNYREEMLDDTLELFTEAWFRRTDERQDVPTGTIINRPIPLDQGLWAVDPLPDVGPLDPNPQLIDGDATTPVTPRIEIGGSSTFRNIGVDVGFTRAISQLEVTVDNLSDPTLAWEVWQSQDNFNWQQVPGAIARWDQTFLRYAIEFPETANRFFKAVNIGVNSEANVAVTEIRAFLGVTTIDQQDGRSNRVQVDFRARYQPHPKVAATFGTGIRNEDDVIPGIVAAQSLQEFWYNFTLRYMFDPKWIGNLTYRFSDFDRDAGTVQTQIERATGASLEWRPVPTVTGNLVLAHRDEVAEGILIRESDAAILRFGKQLYPEMRLNSQISWADVDDPFSGFSQQTVQWTELLESRPKRNWTVGGGFTLARFDSVGTVTLTHRETINLRTTWQALRQVMLAATVRFGEDDRQRFLQQRYAVTWTPGPRFFVTLTYRDDETVDVRSISVASANVTYWLNRRWRFFLSGFRSSENVVSIGRTVTDNVTFGLNFSF